MTIEPLYIFNGNTLFASSNEYSIENMQDNLFQISGAIIQQILPPKMSLFPSNLTAKCGDQLFSQFVFTHISGTFPEIEFSANAI